jgi:uncharacterized protein RhaS with RHS repeats
MGQQRRARRRWDYPAGDRIAAALAPIQEVDQRWHGLARFLA